MGIQGKAAPSAYGVDASQSSTGQLSFNSVASGVKNVQSKAIEPRPAAFGAAADTQLSGKGRPVRKKILLQVLRLECAATISLSSFSGLVEHTIDPVTDCLERIRCGHHPFALDVSLDLAGYN